MSAADAVQCDRCGRRALVDDKDHAPSGWSFTRIQVPRPYCDTGNLDLCDECTPVVYNVVHNKSSAMTVDPAVAVQLETLAVLTKILIQNRAAKEPT